MIIVPVVAQIRLVRSVAISAMLTGMLVLAGCSSTGSSGASSSSGGQSSPSSGRSQSADKASSGVIATIRSISLHEDRASEAAARTPNDSVTPVAPSHVSSPNYASQGRTLSMVGNAVLASLAGDNTDDRPPVADGQEVTVKLDGGGTRVVVQPSDQSLRINQRVRILTGSGPTRVSSD